MVHHTVTVQHPHPATSRVRGVGVHFPALEEFHWGHHVVDPAKVGEKQPLVSISTTLSFHYKRNAWQANSKNTQIDKITRQTKIYKQRDIIVLQIDNKTE